MPYITEFFSLVSPVQDLQVQLDKTNFQVKVKDKDIDSLKKEMLKTTWE